MNNIKFIEITHKKDEEKIVKCNNLSNNMIFKKYDVSLGDTVEVLDNQYAVLIEKGIVYDVKEKPGSFLIMVEIIDTNKDLKEEWKDLKIRKTDNNKLCVIFLNKELIKHNKYVMNNPIKYRDWKSKKNKQIYIKIEGFYDFKIENPKKLLSKVIGLRAHFSKEELIEKIRNYILSSIEKGINEISEEYKLDIEDLPENSKNLEIKLKQNEYDKKLLEYGVKLTYFDIDNLKIVNKKFKFF